MEKMVLKIHDFYEFRDRFPLWSIIHIEVSNEYFPDDQWWDATSSVLEIWMDNLISFIYGSIDFCTLDFLDGDYSINLHKKTQWEAVAICLAPNDKVIVSESIDLLYFARQVLSAVEKIKIFYSEYKNSNIIKSLSNKANLLRHAIKACTH